MNDFRPITSLLHIHFHFINYEHRLRLVISELTIIRYNAIKIQVCTNIEKLHKIERKRFNVFFVNNNTLANYENAFVIN